MKIVTFLFAAYKDFKSLRYWLNIVVMDHVFFFSQRTIKTVNVNVPIWILYVLYKYCIIVRHYILIMYNASQIYRIVEMWLFLTLWISSSQGK